MPYQKKSFAILIIGAGGAGLRAAIEAAKNPDLKIAVVCKSLLGKAHTVMAEGGVAAALGNVDKGDNWKVHFRDTMKGGKMLNNWIMAEIHAKESPERVKELEQWGAVFDRTPDGRTNQRPFGGHSFARLVHVGDRTGLEILRTLQDKVVHLSNVEIFMEHTVVKLLTNNNEVIGVLAYNRNTGDFTYFQSQSIILATGGCARVFNAQTNSWEGTGDGIALAYEAGAELQDMEFMQFHPTGMIWPLSVKGLLVTEGVRGEGGVLKNNQGERFMFRYIPENFKNDVAATEEEANAWAQGERRNNRRPPELLTRDVVARAINAEVKAGRGSLHGGVFLDISSQRSPDYIRKKLPSMYQQFLRLANVDITKEAMEVGPTAHYIMGGIRVDAETAETHVQGLFAAGEVAAGLHGANRLGGNSLSDLLVFGKRAGEYAARYSLAHRLQSEIAEEIVEQGVQESLTPFDPKDNPENPHQLQKELKDLMDFHCGIIRNEKELKEGIEKLEKLKHRAQNVFVESTDRTLNTAWHAALDLKSLLVVSEMMLRVALERTESRGGHTREDYPESDNEWGQKNIVLKKNGSSMSVWHVSIDDIPDAHRKLLDI